MPIEIGLKETQIVARVHFSLLSTQTEARKIRFSELISRLVSLFVLKFRTLNLGDNRPTLESVFEIEERSIHLHLIKSASISDLTKRL